MKHDPLFKDNKTHIKKMADLQQFLLKQRDLPIDRQMRIAERAKKEVHSPSGMSKKEFENKVLRPLQNNPEMNMSPEEARRIKRLTEGKY